MLCAQRSALTPEHTRALEAGAHAAWAITRAARSARLGSTGTCNT